MPLLDPSHLADYQTNKAGVKTNGEDIKSWGQNASISKAHSQNGAVACISLEIPAFGSESHEEKVDFLLIAWILLLYRSSISGVNNGGSNGETFSYGFHDQAEGIFSPTLQISGKISDVIPADGEQISKALEVVQSLRQQSNTSENGGDADLDRSNVILMCNGLSDKNVRDASLAIIPITAVNTDTLGFQSFCIEARISNKHLSLRQSRLSQASQELADFRIYTFVDILQSILSEQAQTVAQAIRIGKHELDQIWEWNKAVPPQLDRCMHEVIAEKIAQHPELPAVVSWDGELTYGELDQVSFRLASQLSAIGIGIGKVVPLCFEKSRWTVVAVLAVMRAGAGFVLTDPAQPEARLRIIATEVDAEVILTSSKQADLSCRVAPNAKVIKVGPHLLDATGDVAPSSLPLVPGSAILYVIFTSGSTGKPKGVVISHSNYTSGALPRAEAVGYKPNSRVLDFASYAFDVSIDCMLCTLSQGGCICVPSDEARVNDLSGAIRNMNVNMAHMTPSVARVLSSEVLASLDVLGLGGESVSAGDAAIWGQKTSVIIAYGPSECTVGCTINNDISLQKSYTSIGKGVGAVTWIVDPGDQNILTPVGAVGELLIEGPIVGVGYINEPEKTAQVFVEDPVWLLAGARRSLGRHGRLYKTGDLVKYDPDGSGDIVFVGRKDRQVKLRGQRIELAEIEHHLRKGLPADVSIAAEVITPAGKGREPTLVAFIAEKGEKDTQPNGTDNENFNTNGTNGTKNGLHEIKDASGLDEDLTTFSIELQRYLAEMNDVIGAELPIYMVPTAYIPLREMPSLVSCKVDRKKLQGIGNAMSLQQLARFRAEAVERREPKTERERKLHELWTKLFGKGIEIGVEDNFFTLGGDSLKAMKLVAGARAEGLSLTVANIFTNPTISKMASTAEDAGIVAEIEVLPFSLLEPNWKPDSARSEIANLCNLDPALIDDVYPCTPLQEGLMALSTKVSEAYIAQRVVDLADVSIAHRLKAAFETIAVDCPILRTRIVQVSGYGLMQAVINGKLSWYSSTNLEQYLLDDREKSMQLGEPLARFATIIDDKSGKTHLVLTMHHALYDGWSIPLLIERVNEAYQGLEIGSRTPFKNFIRHLCAADRSISEDYWRRNLQGASGPQFPPLPFRGYQTQTDTLLEHFVPICRSASSTTTTATAIRGAWALIAAQYTGFNDVVFGETLTGRNAPVMGIEQIEGPLITTVPVRVQIDRNTTISDYLQSIHEQTLLRIPHEHMGLQHIRRLSPDAREACELKTGLVLHPNSEDEDEKGVPKDAPANGLVPAGDVEAAQEALKFSSYPLMLVCSLGSEGFLIMASFDSKTVEVPLMERILREFGRITQQLCESPDACVGDLQFLSEQDVEELWSLSSSGVKFANKSGNTALEEQLVEATAAWIVDPVDTERLLPVGAMGELLIETPNESPFTSISHPQWLVTGYKEFPPRSTPLYKTGHLAKYNSEGCIDLNGFKVETATLLIKTPKKNDLQDEPLMTSLQQKLASLWARVLGVLEIEIHLDDDFFDLGGDSIAAMKLVSEARMEGLEVSVAQVFRHRCLCKMADQVQIMLPVQETKEASAPFSALEVPDSSAFLASTIVPALVDSTWKVVDVLPARPLQQIAVRGTVQLPRYSARYELIYLDAGIDRKQMFKSCQELVSRNEILRTVFVNHAGRCYGVVLEDLKVQIDEYEIEGDIESFARKLCDLDIQTKMPLGSAYVKFFFIKGADGQSCLILKISHAQYDEICLPPLLRQLAALYEGKPLSPAIAFSSFVYHVISENIPKSMPYWRGLLRGSSLTVLRPPGITEPQSRQAISFFKTFDISTRPKGITVATLPTAAWALCLTRRLSLKDITFGEVVSGRNIDLPNCDAVMGPCWQYIPVRIQFQPQWTILDLLNAVQQQHIDSTRFEGMGLEEIIKNCTDWDGSVDWFDSVVHQDVEHVEQLGFLGKSGRFETVYPHLEPLREWKVQAFKMAGEKMGIEIIGFEEWKELAEELLEDMGKILVELTGDGEVELF